MSRNTVATRDTVSELAAKMVQRYVRELVSVDELVEQLRLAWLVDIPERMAGGGTLESVARGLCNQILYECCCLPGGHRRDLAFERLSEYLEWVLRTVGGTICAATREEILQGTLVEILQSLQNERQKPTQPMAFLRWARVILWRQMIRNWRLQQRVRALSLEDQEEPLLAALVDYHAPDPQEEVSRSEEREELLAAIAQLRNPRYREVLLKTYFYELDAREVASLLRASVDEIYLWHHRGLHALHKQLHGTPTRCRRAGSHPARGHSLRARKS